MSDMTNRCKLGRLKSAAHGISNHVGRVYELYLHVKHTTWVITTREILLCMSVMRWKMFIDFEQSLSLFLITTDHTHFICILISVVVLIFIISRHRVAFYKSARQKENIFFIFRSISWSVIGTHNKASLDSFVQIDESEQLNEAGDGF